MNGSGRSGTSGMRRILRAAQILCPDPADPGHDQRQARGLDVLMSGRRENGTGFVCFDTLDQAGVVWMCRQTNPVPS